MRVLIKSGEWYVLLFDCDQGPWTANRNLALACRGDASRQRDGMQQGEGNG